MTERSIYSKEKSETTWVKVSGRFALTTLNYFLYEHCTIRYMIAQTIVRNVVVDFCSEWLCKHQSQGRLGVGWCWTKIGQYVQLEVNVFLVYPALKYLH